METFVVFAALVMTGGAVLTLWSNRQLRAVPREEQRTHPAWTRSGIGLGVVWFGALLIAAVNLLDSTASTSTRVLAVISIVVLSATGVFVVAKTRRYRRAD